MTATTDDIATAGHEEPALPTPGSAGVQPPAERPMIAVALLVEHPGNARLDLSLDEEFLASIAELDILTPLRITPDGDTYRVIDGHRRLAAALQLAKEEVPYDLVRERAEDEAGQYLDMYATAHHTRKLTALEEAGALFAASRAGASKIRIRKATGLGREQVSTALAAGKIRGEARALAEGLGDSATLDQLGLLAEFEGDEAAVNRLVTVFCSGSNGQHVAEKIRQERAEGAKHDDLVAQIIADGYKVSDDQPPYSAILNSLLHDGQELSPQDHTACPGRAVYFHEYQPLQPVHFCTDPEANGHTSRYQPAVLPDLTGAGAGSGPEPGTGDGDAPSPDPSRKLVVEGNKAWVAARAVRRRWLAEVLLARRTAPKQTLPFVTAQLLTMPRALHESLARAPRSRLFADLAGERMTAEAVGGWSAGRLPIAVLAVIAAAYEDRMDGDEGRKTWRTDQPYRQCNRGEAGVYLRFLRDVGYELSPVEQAVADGEPYTGDQPADDLASTVTHGEAEIPADDQQPAGNIPDGEAAVQDTGPAAA